MQSHESKSAEEIITVKLHISQHPDKKGWALYRPEVTAMKKDPKPATDLEFVALLDNSGSMHQGGSIGMLREATKQILDNLPDGYKVTLATFNHQVTVLGETATVLNENTRKELQKKVEEIKADGETDIPLALVSGMEYVANSCKATVAIITDGQSTKNALELKTTEAVLGQAQKTMKEKTQASALPRIAPIGIGTGYKMDELQAYAQATNFRQGHISNPEDTSPVLMDLLKNIGEYLPVQLVFSSEQQSWFRVKPHFGNVVYGQAFFEVFEAPVSITESPLQVELEIGKQVQFAVQHEILLKKEGLDPKAVLLYYRDKLIKINKANYTDKRKFAMLFELLERVNALSDQQCDDRLQLMRELEGFIAALQIKDPSSRDNLSREMISMVSFSRYESSSSSGSSHQAYTRLGSGFTYNKFTRTATIGEKTYQIINRLIDFVKIQESKEVDLLSAGISLSPFSPEMTQHKQKAAKKIEEGKETGENIDAIVQYVRDLIKPDSQDHNTQQDQDLKIVPLETVIKEGKGSNEHRALLSAFLIADSIKQKRLPEGTVRQIHGKADSLIEYAYIIYKPKDDNGLFLINPTVGISYNLQNQEEANVAIIDYAYTMGTEGDLDGALREIYRHYGISHPARTDIPAKLKSLAGYVPSESFQEFAQESMTCPILYEIMTDPVETVEDGHIYDRKAILEWFKNHDTSPLTGLRLRNKTLKDATAKAEQILAKIKEVIQDRELTRRKTLPAEQEQQKLDAAIQQREQALAAKKDQPHTAMKFTMDLNAPQARVQLQEIPDEAKNNTPDQKPALSAVPIPVAAPVSEDKQSPVSPDVSEALKQFNDIVSNCGRWLNGEASKFSLWSPERIEFNYGQSNLNDLSTVINQSFKNFNSLNPTDKITRCSTMINAINQFQSQMSKYSFANTFNNRKFLKAVATSALLVVLTGCIATAAVAIVTGGALIPAMFAFLKLANFGITSCLSMLAASVVCANDIREKYKVGFFSTLRPEIQGVINKANTLEDAANPNNKIAPART